MAKIVKMTVFLVVLFVAYKEALPWIQNQLGAALPDDVNTGAVRCVRFADEANDAFGRRVGRVSGPGGDAGVWEGFVGDIQERIEVAQSACRCPKPSCGKAGEAMVELADFLDQLDVRYRGGSMERNPVSKQIGVNDLLNQARTLARNGG